MPVVQSTAGLTRSDLVARVRKLTGIQSPLIVSDADIKQRLDEAYAEINGLADWGLHVDVTSLSLTAGQSTVPLTVVGSQGTRPSEVLLVEDKAARRVLWPVAQQQYDELPQDVEGVPSRYAVYFDDTSGEVELRLWPVNDAARTLEVKLDGGDGHTFTADGDRPWFAAEFHPLLAYAVASRLLTEEGDESGRREVYDTEVSTYLARMRSRYLVSQDRGLIRMGRPTRRRFGRIRGR